MFQPTACQCATGRNNLDICDDVKTESSAGWLSFTNSLQEVAGNEDTLHQC